MILTFVVFNAFLTTLHPVIKLTSWAAVDRDWRSNVVVPGQTTYSSLANVDDINGWQPIVQPQNWLITTSATLPLSLTSSRLGESERISLMFERQQHQHQRFLPQRIFTFSHHHGNYSKRQTSSLYPVPTPSTLDQAAQVTSSVKLKPYVVANRDTTTTHTTTNHNNYRHLKPKKLYPLEERQYVGIDADTIGTNQVVSQINSNKHANRKPQHSFQDNTMSPAMINSRLTPNPSSTTTKDSFVVHNVNLIDTPSTTTFSNKINDDNVNEMLLPLHAVLDKVKQFCDMLKDIITDDNDNEPAHVAADVKDLNNEQDENGDNDTTNVNFATAMTAIKVLLMKNPTASSTYTISPVIKEAHDFDQHKQQIEVSTSTIQRPLASTKSPHILSITPTESLGKPAPRGFNGENERKLRRRRIRLPAIFKRSKFKRRKFKKKIKKKIKRKFKKYMFPLLIAYKLKFLAMIPLLIGGLTLLVGSTGLAGFFFAMFAAVMTIRSGRGGGGGGRSLSVR